MHPRMRTAALAALALVGATSSTLVATPHASANADDGIKNVIYLLGDGMGRTQVSAARQRYHGADGELSMEKLGTTGQVATYAVQKNSGQPGAADFSPNYVTDSSSAATAWASGVKTYNNANGIDAKATITPTLMELAHAAGLATGNVSTAEITDATPAGQMSHTLQRACQGPNYVEASCQLPEVTGGSPLATDDLRVTPIADQIATNQTADVILGGGLSRFDAANKATLEGNGYTVLSDPGTQTVANKTQLAAVPADAGKVFALFSKGNMTIEKYKRENPGEPEAQEPTVADMTTKAIEVLKAKSDASGKGFYLQVEGALIDKRSHANDAAQTLEETKAFDDAVKVAYDFAKQDGHTLVIVTADHECAGFNIIEKGSFTNAEAAAPPANNDGKNTSNPSRPSSGAKDAVRSHDFINDGGAGQTDVKNFAPATFGTVDQGPNYTSLDGTANGALWLTYLSGNHTGADVPIFSYGAGSELLDGEIDNTDLFDIVGSALGVRPTIPLPADPTVTVTATPAPGKVATALGITGPTLVKPLVTVTYRITASKVPNGGKVVIKDNGKVVKTVLVSAGRASAALRLARGTHRLAASYAGSSKTLPSSTPTLTVVARR
ncbi:MULTISPECIES: alkaline phosphatase [unclassified Nocardioides]|uniref:alkaline phosphatase n=1 Tax=unclassified Nocardioides TaxID=2615069 RepID=UPI000A556E4A|nr:MULTISPECIES: alkaline phosphatase [unclassified Nocardioides]